MHALPRLIFPGLAICLVSCTGLPREKDYDRSPSALRTEIFKTEPLSISTAGGQYPTLETLDFFPKVPPRRVVLLLHELNGQSPGSILLARGLAKRGCKVYVPRFFGEFDKDSMFQFSGTAPLLSGRWKPFSSVTGPIRQDVREIAQEILRRNPGRRLTVIGNCMTGALPFELLTEPRVEIAVISQPALPMLDWQRQRLGLPESAYQASIASMREHPEKRVISFNYHADGIACISGQEHLASRLADAGLAKRHELYIGIDQNHPPRPSATLATLRKHPGWHEIPVIGHGALNQRHSTITGAGEPDLEKYREALYRALGLR